MSDRFILPALKDHQREDVDEGVSALFLEHSVQTVKTKEGEKAIWAIVSDFNTLETMKMLSVCCDAFRRLGRIQLADGLWTLAKQEDFGLNKLQYPEDKKK